MLFAVYGLVAFHFREGGDGHWAVDYTSPQSFITTNSYSLAQQIWRLIEFDWLIKVVSKCFHQ